MMKDRCLNPNNPQFHHYGGRGVGVCDRWVNSFENSYEDMGERLDKSLSLDRIDVEKGYFKENCRWASWRVQSLNKRILNSNKSGLCGVCSYKGGRFRAYITIEGKQVYLGIYDDLFDAYCARKSADNRLGIKKALEDMKNDTN